MNKRSKFSLIVGILIATAIATPHPAKATELDDLKAQMEVMQKTMAQMQNKISELEQENHKQKKTAAKKTNVPGGQSAEESATAPVDTNGDQIVTIAPKPVTIAGHASQVEQRPAFNDQQEAAPR